MANWFTKLFGGSKTDKQNEEENRVEEKMEAPVMNETFPEEEKKEDVVVEETSFVEEKKEGGYSQNQGSEEEAEQVR